MEGGGIGAAFAWAFADWLNTSSSGIAYVIKLDCRRLIGRILTDCNQLFLPQGICSSNVFVGFYTKFFVHPEMT